MRNRCNKGYSSLPLSLFPLFSSPRHVADTLLTGAPKRHTIDRGYALPSLTGADLSEVKGRLNVENRFAIRVYERGNNSSLFRGILSSSVAMKIQSFDVNVGTYASVRSSLVEILNSDNGDYIG